MINKVVEIKPLEGFEPPTPTLRKWYSTAEPQRRDFPKEKSFIKLFYSLKTSHGESYEELQLYLNRISPFNERW
tara:strand:+ start:330 stop:551 length:222 start_codon:yes stop_codon:yes gene_type:complete